MNTEQKKLLTKMKTLIKNKKRRFENRKDSDYLLNLAEIGITPLEAWNQILTLNCNMYFFDTKSSYYANKDTLIFKKDINKTCIYIKLKIEMDKYEEIVVCLSFHKDRKEVYHEMSYM